ncbi:hypothetical protein CEXT_55281, partial [Caerostris extrusa]
YSPYWVPGVWFSVFCSLSGMACQLNTSSVEASLPHRTRGSEASEIGSSSITSITGHTTVVQLLYYVEAEALITCIKKTTTSNECKLTE